MASELDRIFDILQDQNKELVMQGKLLSAIEQANKDSKERLFGTDGNKGVITYLVEENKKNKESIAAIKTSRAWEKGYVMGIAAVLSLAAKYVLGKLGIHF